MDYNTELVRVKAEFCKEGGKPSQWKTLDFLSRMKLRSIGVGSGAQMRAIADKHRIFD